MRKNRLELRREKFQPKYQGEKEFPDNKLTKVQNDF